jgi:CHAT domain-containing protein/Tfp pilus assembly protein PilF
MKVFSVGNPLPKLWLVLLMASYALAGRLAWAQLQPGLVVEKLAKGSEGEKTGLQQGDVLLRWSRGSVNGDIESPFDVTGIEVEQAPRGVVSIEGYRGQEKHTWELGQSVWGVGVRPNLPQNLLAGYLKGEELGKAGKPDEIAENWRRLAAEVRQSSPAWLTAWLLYHGGEQLLRTQHWKEGDALYQEAVEQAPAGSPALLHIPLAWADWYQRRGDMPNAEKYYQQFLKECRKQGNETLMVAAGLNNLGNMSTLHDDLATAQEYYDQALAIRVKLAPGSLVVASSFSNLGNLAIERGDLSKAEEYYLQALPIKEKLAPESLTLANTLNNLGIVADDRGDLQKAEQYSERALVIKQKLAPDSLAVSSSLTNVGAIYEERGNLVAAEKYNRQALAILRKLAPGSVSEATTLDNLGVLAQVRGDDDKAEEYHRQALEITGKLSPGSQDMALSLQSLGDVALDQGKLNKAEDYYGQALAIRQKLSPESVEVAGLLSNMGALALQRNNLAGAEEQFRHALAIAQKDSPGSLNSSAYIHSLADVAQRRGDLAKAEEYERQALAIREKLAPETAQQAESLASLAEIMRRQRQPEAAELLYEKTLQAVESQGARLGGAEETRSHFRAKHAGYYRGYIDLLLADKQPERAFQVLERLRGRSLLEILATARVDIRKGADAALLEKERSLRELLSAKSERRIKLLGEKHNEGQIAAFDKEINELLSQYKDTEEQIRAGSPAYAALTQPQPLSAKEVQQQLLDADTLLLEYSLGEERSYLFAVTRTSLNAYELPKRSEIEGASHHVYELLTARRNVSQGESELQRQARLIKTENEYAQAAAALSRMVLGPVAGQLQKKRLLIVADGVLHYTPFAVLPMPFASDSKTTVPLVAEHETVSLPSASALAVLRREEMDRKPASKVLAVLADPVFVAKDDRVLAASAKDQGVNMASSQKISPDSSHSPTITADPQSDDLSGLERAAREINISGDGIFPRLPFTRREAEAIYSTTGKSDSLEALDFDASKATALSSQLKNYRIIHFATHGLLNNDHPELSGLVFSLVDKQGNSQDGFLRMLDIYNMELNADLVVLSACQTALGKEIGEEGLIGLTRGFMYAGAPRVVASLWKVDDEATAALMKKFYEGMLREHQTPAQALRAAQQWMRAQKPWQSPYYWAGFVLQGEWK